MIKRKRRDTEEYDMMDEKGYVYEEDNMEEESSIDYRAIWEAIKKNKRLYLKVLPVVFVIVSIIALSIPNYYKVTVMLSPELSSSSSSASSLSSIASMFGVKLGNKGTTDAIFPTLYPELMNSVDFKTSLFPVLVHRMDSTRNMTYYDYLKDEQKAPWWSSAVKVVTKSIASLFKDEEDENHALDPFRLTKDETEIVKDLDKKIVCDVDNKSMIITIEVTDQDPWIAATMADSVKERLQNFITDYRTSKARVDLEFNKKLYEKTKAKYEASCRQYSGYSDSNQKSFLQSVNTRKQMLQNEMNLQYQTYAQVEAQLKVAEAKVQEDTPAFTTLQRATVPAEKSGPKRTRMVLLWLFLAAAGVTVYILYKEGQLKQLLGME